MNRKNRGKTIRKAKWIQAEGERQLVKERRQRKNKREMARMDCINSRKFEKTRKNDKEIMDEQRKKKENNKRKKEKTNE